MKVLLSAYACEPNKGSEPGVGWGWTTELAMKGHDVHVITRMNNKGVIEDAVAKLGFSNLNFSYYDLPKWLTFWKKGGRGVHLYYFMWQIAIFFIARRLVRTNKFDFIHHVTFVSVRQPSFLGLLGVPFIFGPVAGGESVPIHLRQSFPLRGVVADFLRAVVNAWVRISPLMNLTFWTSNKIYVTSSETMKLLPKRFRRKAEIKLAIASSEEFVAIDFDGEGKHGGRALFVGNLLYWKGVHLALRAFAAHLANSPESSLTILGNGPDEGWLKRLALDLGIESSVEWVPRIPREEVDVFYRRHDFLLFPSLRDSGGMVVLEAMGFGMPVVSLDLGGPGRLVDPSCGYTVDSKGRSEEQVVDELSKCMQKLREKKHRDNLSRGAISRAKALSWENMVESIYCSDEYRSSQSGCGV